MSFVVRVCAIALVVVACDSRSRAPRASVGPSATEEPPMRPKPSPDADLLAHLEIITGNAKPTDALPLVVAIHGLGDRPESFAHLFDGFGSRARVLVPRAPQPYLDGYSWFPLAMNDAKKSASGIRKAARHIARWLTEIRTTKKSVGRPIVTGFSQGGMLSFALAVHHPEVVAEAIPVSGWLPPQLWPAALGKSAAHPPIVALHGAADTRVPIEPTRDSVAHLLGLGFQIELREFEGVEHSIPPIVRRDLHALLADACERQADR